MKRVFVLVALAVLLGWLIAGCAVAAGVLTAYEITTAAIGIGQRNQHQDAAEAQLEEIKKLRADLRRAGVITLAGEPLSSSEMAREREITDREKSPESPGLWFRIRRMLP